MNKFNKLNELLQDVKDTELLHIQTMCHHMKGTDSVTDTDLVDAASALGLARAAFEQEKTNLMLMR